MTGKATKREPRATGISPSISIAQILEWHGEGYDYPICADTNAVFAACETTTETTTN